MPVVCSIFIIMMAGAFTAHAAKVTLAWDRPEGDVAGYRIYYGNEVSDYKDQPKKTVNSADQTSSEITGLNKGERYYFAMKSFNKQGIESAFSEEIHYDVPYSAGDAGDAGSNGTNGKITDNSNGGGSGTDAGSGSGGWFTEKFWVTQLFDDESFGTAMLSADFDNTGMLTYNEMFRSHGETQTGLKKNYTLTDKGLLFINGEYEGVVSARHKYYVTGNMAKDRYPCTRLGIRQSTGLSAADFTGEYRIFACYRIPGTDTDQPVIASKTGLVKADGAGNINDVQGFGFTGACEVNPQTGRLKITPDGTFSVMHGALSEDGAIFTAVDADDSDGTLMFVIGIRTSNTNSIAKISGSYYMNEFSWDDQLETTGYLLDMYVEKDGSYTMVEIDNTCDCPPESRSGVMSVDGSGRVQAVDNINKENLSAALSPAGELFAMVGEQSIEVGLRQQAAESASGDSQPDSGGGGGCFIGSSAN